MTHVPLLCIGPRRHVVAVRDLPPTRRPFSEASCRSVKPTVAVGVDARDALRRMRTLILAGVLVFRQKMHEPAGGVVRP
jgi:hypothetical protein